MFFNQLVRATTVVLAIVLAHSAAAQDYPNKPITLVIPLSAGGNADASGRNLATVASKYLGGQPVTVMNLPGASGIVGSQRVHTSPPDGYTLLIARGASHAITPAIDPSLPYKWNDWTFLSLLEFNPVVCIVKGDSQFRTIKDLLDHLKTNKGKLNYATAGPGTTEHLAVEILFKAAGLPSDSAVMIGYKGGGEVTQALMANTVQFACNNLPTISGHLKAGTLRGLLVSTKERLKEYPDIPAARELGLSPMEDVVGWSALYGPPGLPAEVVNKWADALRNIEKDADWLRGTALIGGLPAIRSPQDTERFARAQFELYSRVGTELGLRRQAH